MYIEKIVVFRKHILLDRDEVILVDTGSPVSFHKGGVINFGNKENHCATSVFGVDVDYISQQLGRPIAGLLGMDILNKFDNVVFDYPNNRLCLDCDIDATNMISLNSGNESGVPYVELKIGGRCARLFVDTGAPVSYISPTYTTGCISLGTVSDFHPLCGDFTTETYKLPVNVNGQNIEMIFGNLPSLMQMALALVKIDGIIGYEWFSQNKLVLRNGKFFYMA